MLRALLDSNGVDPIADRLGAVDAVKNAINRGDLELLIPERAFEQVGKASEPRRAELLAVAVVAEQVLDGVYMVGRGRVGVHGVAGDADGASYQRIRGPREKDPKGKQAADALISLTAQLQGAVLVTADIRLRNKVTTEGWQVMNPDELLEQIGYVAP